MASGLIDIHAHFLTPSYLAAMRAAGIDTVDGFPLPDWSVDDALRHMDRHGIAKAYLSISAPGISFASGDAARALAQTVNRELADMIGRHPDRFGGFAILPLPDAEAALREVEHALNDLGLDGVILYTNFNGIYPGDARLEPLFAELNRRRAVVYVHPVAPPGFDMARLGFPAPTVEYPFDTTRMIMNLVASGTLRRFPDFRMIVSHGGGTLPFLMPRITRHLTRFAKMSPTPVADEVVAAFKSLYFDVTAVSHPFAIDALLALAPKDRLLYGSDHPFMLASAIEQGARFLQEDKRFDGDLRDAVARGNAEALFATGRGATSS